MKDNVVFLDLITSLDISPDRVLTAAKGKLKSVLVVGWDKDGDLYMSASMADGGDLLWLMEKVKQCLLKDWV